MSTSSLPLSGIRVIDFTQVEFGPCATQILGDFGADVIKVERPGVGDISRTTDPFIAEAHGESAYFMSLNRNKRSIALDLRRPSAIEAVRRLIRGADVFVHNYRPGVAERLGLGYETLRQDNPRLIYACGSGFGDSGPLMRKAGQDLLSQSLSGAVSRNPDADGRPQLYPTALGDFSAGMILAQGILLALFHRERTGQGQKLHVSLLDTMVAMQMQEATQWLLRKREVNWVTQYLIGTFQTTDGAVTVVGVFRPNPLADICRALGLEDLSARAEFDGLANQMRNRHLLWPLLEAGFARLSTDECLKRLDEQDVLCAPVLTLDEALRHPQLEANGTLVEFTHPVHGKVKTVGNPLRLSAVKTIALRSAPLLGEQTEEILREAGYQDEEIFALRADGSLG
ncbi:MAG: CoA transferase [Candidatus Rokubacteria bacterium]|nr:CoA transferase [Candidatus Rokubacteria bacterium]